jgi:hypothetical protein
LELCIDDGGRPTGFCDVDPDLVADSRRCLICESFG